MILKYFDHLFQTSSNLWLKVNLFIHSVHFSQTTMYYLGLLRQEISNTGSRLKYVLSTKLGLNTACQQFLNVSFF